MKQHLLSKAMFVLMAMLMVGTKMQAQEPYAVLTESNTVLTFYYDDQRVARSGMSVGPFVHIADQSWESAQNTITTAVFDASFANCSITSTAYWFLSCYNLTTIVGIENLTTDNVTDMSNMFCSCQSLTSLDLSHFNTANVTDMKGMFNTCSSLTSLDLSSFNTENVTSMRSMFTNCSNLASLDLSHFNTANVTSMRGMFYSCESLKSLDLSHFNTANVTDMWSMFYSCDRLTTIYASDLWNTEKVTDSSNMFYNCVSLVGGQGSKYDRNTTDTTYARIDGGADAPGYFTYKAATGVKGLTRNADLQHAPVYNLGGQQLTAPQRGINIIGGKKVVLK